MQILGGTVILYEVSAVRLYCGHLVLFHCIILLINKICIFFKIYFRNESIMSLLIGGATIKI